MAVEAAAKEAAKDAAKQRAAVEVEKIADVQPAFERWVQNNNLLGMCEQQTGVPREKIAYGILSALGLYLLVGQGAELVCNLIGFGYPAYASVKAIRTEGKDDDTQWLIYWTVYAFLSMVDFFAEIIYSWFPLYWVVKALFLVYLAAPQTRGAIRMYDSYVDPLVYKIDEYWAKYMNGESGGAAAPPPS